MITYDKKEVKYNGCPGCAYYNHEFSLSCGMAYQNDNFTISQDWEVPIKGMMILCPRRHVNFLSELTAQEREELFTLANKTIEILKQNNVSGEFIITFEERARVHFHLCIIPKLSFMSELTDDISGDLKKIIEYAKQNFTLPKHYKEIKETSQLVTKGLSR